MNQNPSINVLNKVVKKLQELMLTQDWEVDVRYLTTTEMINEYTNEANMGTLGMSYRNIRANYALVSINKENCCDKEGETWYDTLVHEMLHVQETQFMHTTKAYMSDYGSYYEDSHEQYIDKLQKMFVKLYPLEKFKEDNPEIFKKNTGSAKLITQEKLKGNVELKRIKEIHEPVNLNKAKKPLNASFSSHDCATIGKCPNCGCVVDSYKETCSCGQKLKWD